jgi:LPS sulfotransferase NodH
LEVPQYLSAKPRCLFAIVATQRSGSTLLARSLDASPFIFCAGEIFHDGPRVHHAEYRYPQRLLGSRWLSRAADLYLQRPRIKTHIDRFYAKAGCDVRAVGFKVMVSQLRRFRALLPLLVEGGVTRLFLHRRDSFAAAISYTRAKASGIYHSDQATSDSAARAISVDPAEFRGMLELCEEAKRELRALHAAHGGVLLAYEDMVNDWSAFTDRLGCHLGIAGLRLPTALKRLGATQGQVRIENESTLRGMFSPDVSD